MNTKFWYMLLLLAVVAFGACDGAQETSNSNTGNESATESAAAETDKDVKGTLSEMELSAYKAWMNKDGKFFEGFLTDNYVSVGANGRGDREMSVKAITDFPCEVKSVQKGDNEVTELGDGIALLTSKDSVDVFCDGKKLPSPNWAATLYVKEGDKWQAAYHQTRPAKDAKGEAPPAPESSTDKPGADSDQEMTEALMAIDKGLWEAWSKKDTKPFEENLTENYVGYGDEGRSDRAAYIKEMGENKCDLKSMSQDAANSTKINDNLYMLTYKSNLDGACDGTALPETIWSTSFFVKDGDKWKSAFWMGTPGA